MPTNSSIFLKYKNLVFIETGSYKGEGIQSAIESGFNKIYSIELSEYYFKYCVEKFKERSDVKIIKGDSSIELKNLLDIINEPVTFWLDGHYSEGKTAKGEKYSPLMEELEIIKSHFIKTHTIIIDDLRCWKKNENYNFDVEDIKNKLFEINKNYTFIIEDSTKFKQDILVAVYGK
jgi:hypothetical protein